MPKAASNADGYLSDRDVEPTRRLLPRPSHLRLEGISHELHGTHPQRVLDAVSRFVDTA